MPFLLTSMKHKTTPETLSIGDKVHINHPKTLNWIGTIVAKRNLPGIWVIRNAAGFGNDVSEEYLTRETSLIPPSSDH